MIQARAIFVSMLFFLILFPVLVAAQETWFGDQQGLWSYSSSDPQPLADLSVDIRCLARTASGGGWIALDGQNLVLHVDADGSILQSIDTVVG
ncbi:MAG TPA: hypothetical protein EYO84_01415, partial [Planctomycetes bacterium]|nr:hypothetical protein [Planctomycetota bacterium]